MHKCMASVVAIFLVGWIRGGVAEIALGDDANDPAAMFLALDANKDGQLSGDEVPEAHKRLFERLLRTSDKDGDGKLALAEFTAGLSETPDKPNKKDEPANRERPDQADQEARPGKLFKRLDANGDGKVALDEVPEPRRDMFKKLVARGDKDGDGALSREEFVRAFPRGDEKKPEKPEPGKRPEGRPEAAKFFRRLDVNGDGKVTLDEVPEPVKPRIEQLIRRADKNGDKAVSLEEFLAAAPGRPGEGRPGEPRPERPPAERGLPLGGIFRALDADHDGKLSSGEISAAAEAIRKLDTDGDGNVTVEELIAAGPPRDDK